MYTKQALLEGLLSRMGSVAVAFSGGVDSTYLLAVAKKVLGDRVCAVTVNSAAIPKREYVEAVNFCRQLGVNQIVVPVDVTAVPHFCDNPADRCYHCKQVIFSAILKVALEEGFLVVDGSNADDTGDYRPGMKALSELSIQSPLLEAGLHKAEIRALSKEMGLATADKPSYACLASRFAYGEPITVKRLAMVEDAEDFLLKQGFTQFRVRVHGVDDHPLARIEVDEAQFSRLLKAEVRGALLERMKTLGFSYVTFDLKGYRTGSMNETL